MVAFLAALVAVLMAVGGGVVVGVFRGGRVVVLRVLVVLSGLVFVPVLVVFMVGLFMVDVVLFPGVVQPVLVALLVSLVVGLVVLRRGLVVLLRRGGVDGLRVVHGLLWSGKLLVVRLVSGFVLGVVGRDFSDVGVVLGGRVRRGRVRLGLGSFLMMLVFLEHCFQL